MQLLALARQTSYSQTVRMFHSITPSIQLAERCGSLIVHAMVFTSLSEVGS